MNVFDIINVPLGYVIQFCYALVHNYAIALLLFAIIVKALLFPLGIKQQKNMQKQAKMKPKEMAIRKKYAGRNDKVTQQKVNEEIMKLYQQENFNPMGGCLPMLVQLPVIFALYNIVTMPLRYICSLSVETITQIQTVIMEQVPSLATVPPISQIELVNHMRDLGMSVFSGIEGLKDFNIASLPDFNILGGLLDLAKAPSFAEPSWLLVIPLLTLLVTFFSMRLTRKMTYQPGGDAAAGGGAMKIMDFTMPLFSVYITFTVAAAVGLYWIYQNILGFVQQLILSKMFPLPQFTEDDYRAAEKEMNVNIKSVQRKKVRSLHHIDDEDDEKDESNAIIESSATEKTMLIQKAPLKEAKPNNEKATETEAAEVETDEEKKTITPSQSQKYLKTGQNYKKKK